VIVDRSQNFITPKLFVHKILSNEIQLLTL